MAFALTLVLLVMWTGSPASAEGDLRWHHLELHASKLGIGFDTTIEVEPGVHREGLEEEALQVRIESRYLGRRSLQEIWLAPESGHLLASRSQRRSKGSSYWNDRIYEETGIRRMRAAPSGREEWDLEPEQWTHRQRRDEVYPPGIERCSVVTSAVSILLWTANPERMEAACFLADDSVWHLEVRQGDLEYLDLPDPITFPGESESRSRLLVRPLYLEPVPLVAGTDQDEFSLLGLEGAVTVYMELSTGAPVQVRGRLGIAGTVEARITALD